MRRLVCLLAVLLLTGCAMVLAPAAPGPRPENRFVPDEPKAVLLAIHGFNMRAAIFDAFAAFAARSGVAVIAYDQQGFGANPNRGLWPGATTIVDDALDAIERAGEAFPGLPLYVLGDSMGAAVATLALARPDAPRVNGVILVSPGVWGGDALNPFYKAILWLASRLLPGLKLTGEGLDRLPSDNLAMLKALGRDPLIVKETRLDAVQGVVGLMGAARAAAYDLDVPTLVLLGANDQIVPNEVQVSFAERIASPSCGLILYPEGYHMLLNDLQRERVWADILKWLDRRPLPEAVPCRAAGRVPALEGAGSGPN